MVYIINCCYVEISIIISIFVTKGNSKKKSAKLDPDEGEEKDTSRPRRKAARNVATNAYIEDTTEGYVDSPATAEEEEEEEEGGGIRKRKRSIKVPRIKIKMIGRSSDNDSPIFCAQSLEEVRGVVRVWLHVAPSNNKAIGEVVDWRNEVFERKKVLHYT